MGTRTILDGNNLVAQIVELESGALWQPPVGYFLGPDVGNPSIGDTWDGANYIAPAAPALPAPTVDELKSYAADVRWKKETGGTVVGGIAIPTDDRAKVLLLGAATSMAPDATAKYIVGNASVTLTGTQFAALYAGLVAHVQACFETQDVVISQIDAGTITTKAEIDGAFA